MSQLSIIFRLYNNDEIFEKFYFVKIELIEFKINKYNLLINNFKRVKNVN